MPESSSTPTPDPDAAKVQVVLDDLADLAVEARMGSLGLGLALSDDITALVARYTAILDGTAPAAAAPAVSDDPALAAAIAADLAADAFDEDESYDDSDEDESYDVVPAAVTFPDGETAYDDASYREDMTYLRGRLGLPHAGQPAGQPAGNGNLENVAGEPGGELDALNGLVAQINEIGEDATRAALPQSLLLTLTREDTLPVTEDLARQATTLLLPSLVDVVGELTIGQLTFGEDGEVYVTLDVAGENFGAVLLTLGAGRDGFSASLPVGAAVVNAVATIAMPTDMDLAAELGTLPEALPEVPEGQHAINGVLQVVEELTGQRPEAEAGFRVVYRKVNGAPLSEAEVEQVVAHPVSSGRHGLGRFGRYQHVATTPGEDAATQVATFLLLEAGEIDLATVALTATAYRGTFDFGGTIGEVSANAEADLVRVDVEV